MTSTEHRLRDTVAALMRATRETQHDLGRGIRLSQAQVSRKQSGASTWTLGDLDRLAAHYEIPAPDLLCGMDHAVSKLPPHRRAALVGGAQTVIHTALHGA